MLAFAVAIACPGLLKKEITEHFRKCILVFFIHSFQATGGGAVSLRPFQEQKSPYLWRRGKDLSTAAQMKSRVCSIDPMATRYVIYLII